MTREKALQMTHECRITSLGEFAHGFVMYQNASKEIINQIYDHLEQRIAELESPKSCDWCMHHAEQSDDGWGVCSNLGSWLYLEETPSHATCQYYEPKEK